MLTPEDKLVIQTIADNYMNDNYSCCPISSSSSSDSTDSDDFVSNKRIKVTNFMDRIAAYNNEDFKSHFRLTRETTATLVDLYESSDTCPNHNHGSQTKVGARKEIHLFLWYVANTITYRQVGNLFGICDSTTWKIVNRAASWMVSVSNEYIVWPHSSILIQRTTTSFEMMGGISGVLRAIDGSHVKIRKPSLNQEVYFNRKGYHSVILQAVVDSKKLFIDVYCGEPGSMHDARVLRRSPLFRFASQNAVFNDNTFLLGDSAYPSNIWLVPPFKDTGNLMRQQKDFNKIHSSSRIVVENAFGLMKCRFRRLLHFTEHIDLGTVKNIIVACCMLHNICIKANDTWEESEIDESLDNNSDLEGESENNEVDRRQQVINRLLLNNLL